jgi:NAD-dependent dihydropyrimidine dehydrogenase PreA subunit
VVNRNRCEAKHDCVDVCPYDVFVVRVLTREERVGVSIAVGSTSSLTGAVRRSSARPEACHACGLCVTMCPERAIKLTAR